MSGAHKWQFFRQGGFDQVVLKTADDIRAIPDLDQKLWVVLACPTEGLELDPRTLAVLDTNDDGRIRAPEVIDAVRWMVQVLKDPGDLVKREAVLPLAALRTDTPEGRSVAEAARRILTEVGRPEATGIGPEDTGDTGKVLANTLLNGDGVVPPETVQAPETKRVIEEIIDTVGGEEDCSGKIGVSQAKVEVFFTALSDYATWVAAGQAGRPLGEDTAAAAEIFVAVRDKIEDYFTRGRLAAFDPRAAEHLARPEEKWIELAEHTLSEADAAVAAFPLAAIGPGRPLPLHDGLNPAWAGKIAEFKAKVVLPLLGDRVALTADQWADLKRRFAPYEAWLHDKKGAEVEKLGLPRIQALLASTARTTLEALIAEDESHRVEAEAIQAVDKAALLYRDLHRFLCNFVSLSDFYRDRELAVFQTGTLYLDARSCELCLAVGDINEHSKMASLSGICLAYCQLTREGETRNITAAFTNGDEVFLRPGRNGLFYDRQGRDWDATIVKLLEAAISVRQAFWMPYKRVARLVTSQVEKFAGAKDKAAEEAAAKKVVKAGVQANVGVVPVVQPAPAAPKAPTFDIAKFSGIFAAIGLALGAIGGAIAAVFTGFLGLKLWQMPLAITAVLLLISGPAMIMAWLKLRRRNIAPLLDAGDWAVNAQAKLNVPFGARLTKVAKLPPDTSHDLSDPYAEPKPKWLRWVILVVVIVALSILWETGLIKRWLGM